MQRKIARAGATSLAAAGLIVGSVAAGAAPASASYVGPCAVARYPTLSLGSTGPCVAEVQGKLAGFGIAADGNFGGRTYNAVRYFQYLYDQGFGGYHFTQIMTDGVVGPQTYCALGVHCA